MEELQQPFFKSIKGKVLIGFLLALIAMGVSWFISKGTLEKMLDKVDQLSVMDDRLRIVNSMFRNMFLVEKLQDNLSHSLSDDLWKEYDERYAALLSNIDTLEILSGENEAQAIRIDTVRQLVNKQLEYFLAYANVRSMLINNSDMNKQLASISSIMNTNPEGGLVQTEKKKTTTTIYNDPDAQEKSTEKKKGFLKRLFKGKKDKEEESSAVVVQKEEFAVSIDTLARDINEKMISKVKSGVKSMASGQINKTSRFIEQEHLLLVEQNKIISELLHIMEKVEEGVILQNEKEKQEANDTVKASITNIGWIVFVVFGMCTLFGYFIFSDITQSNRIRQQLVIAKEEAEFHSQAKQRFLANMSHEIRTPLQTIIGYSDMITAKGTVHKEELDIVKKSSQHLLFLVNEILDYSKIISDQFEFNIVDVELGDLLQSSVSQFLPQFKERELTLHHTTTIQSEVYAKLDPFRVQQIFYNLIGNAMKFTKKGGVDIAAEILELENKKWISLRIRDTGIGISKDTIDRIFNQFEQGEANVTAQYGGAGLGLSIVKSLVTKMGGEITVASEVGKYTEFTLLLPFVAGEKPVNLAEKNYEEQETKPFFGEVWLVDDDSFILKWLSDALELQGITYKKFKSGEEVLSATWSNAITHILIDMRLQDSTGVEVAQVLRSKATQNVKMIACTAMAMPEERSLILASGFDDILMKPFSVEELLCKLGTTPKKIKAQETIARTIPTPELDLSSLRSMTMGDEELLQEALEMFVHDTNDDLTEIQTLLAEGEQQEQLKELFHRMAGRIGQIGSADLGISMRQIELKLETEIPLESIQKVLNETGVLITYVKSLLK